MSMKETCETRTALGITHTRPLFIILIAGSDAGFNGESERETPE